MPHRNAPLSELGRLRLARCVVEEGWPLRRAAERFQVSVTTAARWASRYRQLGAAGMADRSSRPRRSPNQTPVQLVAQVVALRTQRGWGPARIGPALGMPASTVHKVLARAGMPRLGETDLATRQAIRRKVRRYEHPAPGDLVHVDIKKLGRIPDGGGHKVVGRQTGRKNRSGAGYSFIHVAVDDHSRLVYAEILTDETQHTAVAFWTRAQAFFTACGITVKRVLTDNGSCYKSRLWRDHLAQAGITHKRTRPYRPQTNGKAERFNRTLLTEWAYAHPYTSETARQAAFTTWLHTYNHHRHHTALGGHPPATRVPNLSGQYT
ncbi:IS481 family transposase [Actinopolymorpha pittospori]